VIDPGLVQLHRLELCGLFQGAVKVLDDAVDVRLDDCSSSAIIGTEGPPSPSRFRRSTMAERSKPNCRHNLLLSPSRFRRSTMAERSKPNCRHNLLLIVAEE
jgi:hypothetical protein